MLQEIKKNYRYLIYLASIFLATVSAVVVFGSDKELDYIVENCESERYLFNVANASHPCRYSSGDGDNSSDYPCDDDY